MTESTARHALPLIAPGQAQKEIAHNEALALLDLLVQPAVQAVGTNTPPTDPAPGQCWIVGRAPTAAWLGHADALAGWSAGGWRFVAPVVGSTVLIDGAAGFARYAAGGWETGRLVGSTLTLAGKQVVGARRPAIAAPTGGATPDAEARTAIAAIIAALTAHGLVETA